MEQNFNDWQRQPRPLLYRAHYRWYAIALSVLWGGCLVALSALSIIAYSAYREEILVFGSFCFMLPVFYGVWLHPKLTRSMQVFHDRIRITSKSHVIEIIYSELQAITTPFGQFIRLHSKDGAWTFGPSLERLD